MVSGESALELERVGRLAPGAAEQPARAATASCGFKPWNATRENTADWLRLAVATHVAVNHHAAVVEQRQRRVEGVEGLLSRHKRIDMGGIEREGCAAVLPVDAGLLSTTPEPNL